MGGKAETPINVPRDVERSWKKEPVDSVSRSEEEGEDMLGEMGGGRNSFPGSNITTTTGFTVLYVYVCVYVLVEKQVRLMGKSACGCGTGCQHVKPVSYLLSLF